MRHRLSLLLLLLVPAERAVAQADTAACAGWTAAQCRDQALTERNSPRGRSRLEAACALRDGVACSELGLLLEPQEPQRSAALYRAACGLGLPDGCRNYAVSVEHGTGVPKDEAWAFAEYQRLCWQRDWRACTFKALSEEFGRGTAPDAAAALNDYVQACNQGEGRACAEGGRLAHEKSLRPPQVVDQLLDRGCGAKQAAACFLRGKLTADPAAKQRLLREACSLREGRACSALGFVLHRAGDLPGAKLLFVRACEQGSAPDCLNAAHLAWEQGDFGGATAAYGPLCQAGSQRACVALGVAHLSGKGVAFDLARAAAYFDAACAAQEPRGCVARGWQYQDYEKRLPQARASFRAACELSPTSCVPYSETLRRGIGGKVDREGARAVLERACEGGNSSACVNLGWYLYVGELGPADAQRGAELASRACTAGNQVGCSNFGLALAEGKGIPQDLPRGLELMTEVAERSKDTYENLALLAEHGAKGLPPDPVHALKLYAVACVDGHNDAACDAAKRLATRLRKPAPARPPPPPAAARTAGAEPVMTLPSIKGLLGAF